MTSIAPEDTLRGLDEETRQAWSHYSERLRELSGTEYDRIESESWDTLQDELRRLDEQREQLNATTAGPGVG